MVNKLESTIEELGLREHFNKEKNIIKKTIREEEFNN